jgi:hypothetical protein
MKFQPHFYAASTIEEIVFKTPFGEAHIPRLEMPKPPTLSGFVLPVLPEIPPAIARLAQATAGPQQQLGRAYEAMTRLQEDVEQSARLMFDESDAVWDECLDESGNIGDSHLRDGNSTPGSGDVHGL